MLKEYFESKDKLEDRINEIMEVIDTLSLNCMDTMYLHESDIKNISPSWGNKSMINVEMEYLDPVDDMFNWSETYSIPVEFIDSEVLDTMSLEIYFTDIDNELTKEERTQEIRELLGTLQMHKGLTQKIAESFNEDKLLSVSELDDYIDTLLEGE